MPENHIEDPTLLEDNGENEEFAETIDDDELKKPLLTEIARKKHFKGKFEKSEGEKVVLEAKIKELEGKPPKTEDKPKEDDELKSNVNRLLQSEDKRVFGHTNGYSPDETDEIFAYATGKGIKPEEAKDSPFIKSALDSMRDQKKAEDNTPGGSKRAPLYDGKTFGQVVSDVKSTPADKQTAFEGMMGRKGNTSAE